MGIKLWDAVTGACLRVLASSDEQSIQCLELLGLDRIIIGSEQSLSIESLYVEEDGDRKMIGREGCKVLSVLPKNGILISAQSNIVQVWR